MQVGAYPVFKRLNSWATRFVAWCVLPSIAIRQSSRNLLTRSMTLSRLGTFFLFLVSAENLSKLHVWNIINVRVREYYVSKAAILVHFCLPCALIAFALIFFLGQAITILHLKHASRTTYYLALVTPKRIKTCLRQDASSGALRGPLGRGPLTSRGVGRGRGEAATISALVGSSVLAYDAASTYCTG